jgi:hypothetical protein
MVKNSKKTEQILKKLDKIEEFMYYFMMNTEAFHEVKSDLSELREYISELSLDRKEHNARFAKKLKGLWDQEHD